MVLDEKADFIYLGYLITDRQHATAVPEIFISSTEKLTRFVKNDVSCRVHLYFKTVLL